MIRMTLLALLIFAQTSVAMASAICTGADPTIMAVAVKRVSSNGKLNVYHLSGRVVNRGGAEQAPNVLQFVGIYEDGVRRDVRSIPPLKAGASFRFTYRYARSVEAGVGTSKLTFRLYRRGGLPLEGDGCNRGSNGFAVRF